MFMKDQHCLSEKVALQRAMWRAWPRGYKTSFMLNSAEHEICPANKSQITDNAKFFLAKHN